MCPLPNAVSRRRLLLGIGSAATLALAGCLGDDAPDPVTIGEVSCDNCGMVVTEHPGPSGQAFYEGSVPEDRDSDEPAYFCASTCAYRFVFDQREAGDEPQVLYLTDYSTVDWEVSGDDNGEVISAHLDADDHGPASDLHIVVGTDVQGSMGPAMVPFSDPDDADAFVAEYGGSVVEHDDVNRELLESL